MDRIEAGRWLPKALGLVTAFAGWAGLFLVTAAPGGGSDDGTDSGKLSLPGMVLLCVGILVAGVLFFRSLEGSALGGGGNGSVPAKGRFAVVRIAVLLDDAAGESARALDHLVRTTDFSAPAGRAVGLHRVTSHIYRYGFLDGSVSVSAASQSRPEAAEGAEQLARAQMARLDLPTERVEAAVRGYPAEPGTAGELSLSSPGEPGGLFEIGITVSITGKLASRLLSGDTGIEAAEALSQISHGARGNLDAVYLYFAPVPGGVTVT